MFNYNDMPSKKCLRIARKYEVAMSFVVLLFATKYDILL